MNIIGRGSNGVINKMKNKISKQNYEFKIIQKHHCFNFQNLIHEIKILKELVTHIQQ